MIQTNSEDIELIRQRIRKMSDLELRESVLQRAVVDVYDIGEL